MSARTNRSFQMRLQHYRVHLDRNVFKSNLLAASVAQNGPVVDRAQVVNPVHVLAEHRYEIPFIFDYESPLRAGPRRRHSRRADLSR